MNGPVTWETLRTLAEEVGIGEEFQEFQNSLTNLFTGALLDATNTANRFRQDPVFKSRVEFLVSVMVSALVQHEYRSMLTTRELADLTQIFEQEAQTWRQ